MRDQRWKMYLCLFSIVLAAIIIGMFYYGTVEKQQKEETGGLLVEAGQEVEHGC